MPTVVNRGLGLLEVILPQSSSESLESVLPPGSRDESGFWLPKRCEAPGDLFSPDRRRQQLKQRRIQRRRLRESAAGKSSGRKRLTNAGKTARRRVGAMPDGVSRTEPAESHPAARRSAKPGH